MYSEKMFLERAKSFVAYIWQKYRFKYNSTLIKTISGIQDSEEWIQCNSMYQYTIAYGKSTQWWPITYQIITY